jgi:hypothetical protein
MAIRVTMRIWEIHGVFFQFHENMKHDDLLYHRRSEKSNDLVEEQKFKEMWNIYRKLFVHVK